MIFVTNAYHMVYYRVGRLAKNEAEQIRSCINNLLCFDQHVSLVYTEFVCSETERVDNNHRNRVRAFYCQSVANGCNINFGSKMAFINLIGFTLQTKVIWFFSKCNLLFIYCTLSRQFLLGHYIALYFQSMTAILVLW